MPLTLHVDVSRWRDHLRRFSSPDHVTIAPVTKGNGYGFGNTNLASEATGLGVETLAVGTYEEIADVHHEFAGDILVLSPWRPWRDVPVDEDRVIHTISRVADLHTLTERGGRPRVVVEVLTSMRRHGIEPAHLSSIAQALGTVRFEGFALHLPLSGDHAAEARELGGLAFKTISSSAPRTLWVSHLAPMSAAKLASETGSDVRLRVGSMLWLGDRGALAARSTVLDVHQVHRGQQFGYRQRRAWRTGSLLIVAGGTAHGVALEAPSPVTSARQRAVSIVKGGLEATGQALSPFRVAGKQRWFAEPPHMQCSMIWLPDNITPPDPGDELELDVRFTTTTFDHITWL